MHEPMLTAVLLSVAVLCSVLGFACLALAMDVHWEQVRGPHAAAPGTTRTLRVLGVVGLVASLAICLVADHASIAALVWVMALAAGALVVAFTLSWRPRLLAPLVAWAPARGKA